MPSTLIVSRFGCAKGDVESKLGSLSSCPFVGLDCGMRQREVTCGAGSQGMQLLDVQTAPGLRQPEIYQTNTKLHPAPLRGHLLSEIEVQHFALI